MKKIFISLLTLVLCASCASQIMQDYVGKPLTDPILDYGQPIGSMDMEDGTRAFQWKMQSNTYIPQTTTFNSNTYANIYGTQGNAFTTGTSTTYGGYTASSDCTYTLFAKRVNKKDIPASWIITGFRQPRLDCE